MDLSPNELKLLKCLKVGTLTPHEASLRSELGEKETMSAASWLRSKGLVTILEESTTFLFPNEEMGNNNQTNASLFIEKLIVLSKELGLPQKLRDVSIPEDACTSMAKDAMKQTRLLVNNPREVTEQDAYDIYHSIW